MTGRYSSRFVYGLTVWFTVSGMTSTPAVAGWPSFRKQELPPTEMLARKLDHVEHQLNEIGTVVAKKPDVYGESRLTRHRQEIEEQLAAKIDDFELLLNASLSRSDQTFLANAFALQVAATPGGAANDVPTAPLIDSTTIFGDNAAVERSGPFESQAARIRTGGKFGFAGAGVALEPTIQLDQLQRYLSHLQELRRLNEGPDSADGPGYALNLIRIPVSITPGDETRKGHGASVTITAETYLTPELLPTTFRTLVIEDLLDQLALPVRKRLDLLLAKERLEAELAAVRNDQARAEQQLRTLKERIDPDREKVAALRAELRDYALQAHAAISAADYVGAKLALANARSVIDDFTLPSTAKKDQLRQDVVATLLNAATATADRSLRVQQDSPEDKRLEELAVVYSSLAALLAKPRDEDRDATLVAEIIAIGYPTTVRNELAEALANLAVQPMEQDLATGFVEQFTAQPAAAQKANERVRERVEIEAGLRTDGGIVGAALESFTGPSPPTAENLERGREKIQAWRKTSAKALGYAFGTAVQTILETVETTLAARIDEANEAVEVTRELQQRLDGQLVALEAASTAAESTDAGSSPVRRSRLPVPPSRIRCVFGSDSLDAITKEFRRAHGFECQHDADVHLTDIRGFLKEELEAAYDYLESPANRQTWAAGTGDPWFKTAMIRDGIRAGSPYVDHVRSEIVQPLHCECGTAVISRLGGEAVVRTVAHLQSNAPPVPAPPAVLPTPDTEVLEQPVLRGTYPTLPREQLAPVQPPGPSEYPPASQPLTSTTIDNTYEGVTARATCPTTTTATTALAWAILAEASLLEDQLNQDLERVAADPKCGCNLGQAEYRFADPNPDPEARQVFNEYVRCRFPIHVFALDPVTQEQNVADAYSMRQELQLAAALAFAGGRANAQDTLQYVRRIEADLELIDLNRTAVAFGHGDATFGWRFYPRIQTPDIPGTIPNTFRTLFRGGPNRDTLRCDYELQPGMRELTALVVMPSFVPHVEFNIRSHFFKLRSPDKVHGTLEQDVEISRDLRDAQRLAEVCHADADLYLPGETARLLKRSEQLAAKSPLATLFAQVPYENTTGGFELFSSGVTDLAPELLDFYGSPGIDPTATTRLFLVGKNFSVHDTRVIAGNQSCDFRLLSREIMEVTIPPGTRSVLCSEATGVVCQNCVSTPDCRCDRRVEVHLATPYGITRRVLIPVLPPPTSTEPLEYVWTEPVLRLAATLAEDGTTLTSLTGHESWSPVLRGQLAEASNLTLARTAAVVPALPGDGGLLVGTVPLTNEQKTAVAYSAAAGGFALADAQARTLLGDVVTATRAYLANGTKFLPTAAESHSLKLLYAPTFDAPGVVPREAKPLTVIVDLVRPEGVAKGKVVVGNAGTEATGGTPADGQSN